tara:strand:- start:252 stop:467 length:216 start_codon:yes stop_codon:yes gene_type:complete
MIYVIYDMANINDVDYSKVLETSRDTIRTSIDGTKTFFKFRGGTTPSFLEGLQQYDHSEIKTILSSSEWTE